MDGQQSQARVLRRRTAVVRLTNLTAARSVTTIGASLPRG